MRAYKIQGIQQHRRAVEPALKVEEDSFDHPAQNRRQWAAPPCPPASPQAGCSVLTEVRATRAHSWRERLKLASFPISPWAWTAALVAACPRRCAASRPTL
jgi:hypothetical protein